MEHRQQKTCWTHLKDKRQTRAKIAAAALAAILGLGMPVGALGTGNNGGQQAYASEYDDYQSASQAATEASNAYEEAAGRLEEITAALETKSAEVTELEQQVVEGQAKLGEVAVSSYKSGSDFKLAVTTIFTGTSLKEVITNLENLSYIQEYKAGLLAGVKATKANAEASRADLEKQKGEQEAVVAEASTKKEEANEARDKARAAWQATQKSSGSGSTRININLDDSEGFTEEWARNWIIQHESGGRVSVTNGRYYGLYQMDSSRLNGDYSEANQHAVAQAYVDGRYSYGDTSHSWRNAYNFWQSHGWY